MDASNSSRDSRRSPHKLSARFPQATAETYRGPEWPDGEIENWIEFYRRERAASLESSSDRAISTSVYCQYKLKLLEAERARRRRLKCWHPGSPKRNRAVVDLAHDLKATWPIDQFLEQLLMVPLKPAGPNQWRGRCVSGLHEDRRPSMWVYGDDGHVHCYSCGLHGDVLDLTRLNFGLDSFAAAVEKLADVTVTWTGEEG